MALTMRLERRATTPWPADIAAEFERERQIRTPVSAPSCCRKTIACACGKSASQPGERIGFHRHMLDYFWTAVTGGRGRQHVHDGTTVEYTYQPGETRHETYGAGEFKVHDLENLGDKEMVFMTVEFVNSAPISRCRCPHRCGPRPSSARCGEDRISCCFRDWL